jgi:hypothetical protein
MMAVLSRKRARLTSVKRGKEDSNENATGPKFQALSRSPDSGTLANLMD